MTYELFISHARADTATARRLAPALAGAGFRVFADLDSLAAEASFADALSRAIEESTFVLVLLSHSYVASRWAQQELRLAMEQELRMPDGAVKVIPLRIDNCEVPFLLRDKPIVELGTDEQFPSQVERLIADLKSLREPGRKPADRSAGDLSGQQGLDVPGRAALLARLDGTVRAFASTGASPEAARLRDAPPGRVCFIVMPFGREDLDIVYEDFVRTTLETHCDLVCKRVDDLFGSNVIMDDIRSSIGDADLILADLTGKNANVFYEVGIAHTLKRPVLLLAQSLDDVPFDLRHHRVLLYEYSPRGCRKLETGLRKHVFQMLGQRD